MATRIEAFTKATNALLELTSIEDRAIVIAAVAVICDLDVAVTARPASKPEVKPAAGQAIDPRDLPPACVDG